MTEYQSELAKQLGQKNEVALTKIAETDTFLALNARHLYRELKRAEVENPLVRELMRSLALSGERIDIAYPHEGRVNSKGMMSLGLSGKGFDIHVKRDICDSMLKTFFYEVGDMLTDGPLLRHHQDYFTFVTGGVLVSPTSARLRHYSVTMEGVMDILQREAESRISGKREA